MTSGTARPPGGTGRSRATRALGRYGEELAARRLTATGLRILARNWRCGRTGEIDIVARDHDTLVICEVKTRRHGAYEHPMAAVTPRKAARLRRLADCWLDRTDTPAPDGGIRIDLVGIVLPRRGAPVLTHARGVA
ncbi:YraN family protein [Streptomyces sp. NPDC059247]|uniref:YraN family protein n=1 Tax=Streptomyces sp. NPDC059247 TaxID=3346790 RepID=UPI0036792093